MKKKTRGKRLLSILLACIMMISLVPSTVFAVSPSSITLTEAGKTPVQIIINDELTETTNDVDGKWTYTKSTNTLELKGWEGQKLYANGDLNLVLTDTNTITMATNDDFGIKLGNGGDGKLTVSGEGTLTIKGENLTQKAYGIYGKLNQSSGTINITLSTSTDNAYLTGVERTDNNSNAGIIGTGVLNITLNQNNSSTMKPFGERYVFVGEKATLNVSANGTFIARSGVILSTSPSVVQPALFR